LNTDDWLHCNGDLDNTNDSEEDWAADEESDIEHTICFHHLECPEQENVSDAPIVSGLVRPTWNSKRQAEKVFGTVNGVETPRNTGGKKCCTKCITCSPPVCNFTEIVH
jgi:hypothetical protein